MPSEVSWYHHKRVIMHRVRGKVTMEDISEMARAQDAYLREGQPPVHALFDISQVDSFPTDVRALKAVLSTVDSTRLGWVAVVGIKTPLQHFVTSVVAKLVIPGAKMRFLSSIDEVPSFLEHIDSTFQPASYGDKS
jgi:hypothetical protein